MTEYNFDFLDSEEVPEEPRQNLRIITCCGNCKFFWYVRNKPKRGFCRLPNPHLKFVDRKGGESYDEEEIRKTWLRVHITNLCDHHIFKSTWSSIGRVSDWVEKKFNIQGTLEE